MTVWDISGCGIMWGLVWKGNCDLWGGKILQRIKTPLPQHCSKANYVMKHCKLKCGGKGQTR